MEGGSNTDNDKFVNLVKKLTDNDFIYHYTVGTTPGLIVFVIVLLILIGVGIYYGRQSMYVNGTTLPGVGNVVSGYTMINWMVNGLYKFYTVKQDEYFFKDKKGNSGTTTPTDITEFTQLIKELRTEPYKDAVHYFCDQVLPCSGGSVNTACTCKDPDGKQLPQCQDKKVLTPSAAAILDSKKDMAQYFFGIIPKCCCTKLGAGIIKGSGDIIAKNLTLELPSCSYGSGTINVIKGEKGENISSEPLIISASNSDECAGVDCSNEPDYTLLSIPLYDKDGKINPKWVEEANKYPDAKEVMANPKNKSELSSKIKDQPKPNDLTNPNNPDNPNLLTNSKEKFSGNTKKISPFAKIIDAQVKRLEQFKQPDNIETLLTEVPVKSKRIKNKKLNK